jgi:predicted RNA methylase
MKAHYTPKHLISSIKRHLPKKYERVLEPSVGDGALLESLIKNNCKVKLTALDINESALSLTNKKYSAHFSKVEFINDDFLMWSSNLEVERLYDLVIMNPPFCARKKNWVSYDNHKVPIEVAFLKAAIALCEDGGTLVAILPQSIISGALRCSLGLRRELFELLDIRYCYELTEYEFPKIEGRFYLLVGKKGKGTASTVLRSNIGSDITLSFKEAQCSDYRLDYNFHYTKVLYEKIRRKLGASTAFLNDISNIFRGNLSAPFEKNSIIHTTSYNGSWNENNPRIFPLLKTGKYVSNGDILLKRVGRKGVQSLGLYSLNRNQAISDCILAIRVDDTFRSEVVLFSLRVLYACSEGERFLYKGTGAKFVAVSDLKKAIVIYNLNSIFPDEYVVWLAAINRGALESAIEIEKEVRRSIFDAALTNSFNIDNNYLKLTTRIQRARVFDF